MKDQNIYTLKSLICKIQEISTRTYGEASKMVITSSQHDWRPKYSDGDFGHYDLDIDSISFQLSYVWLFNIDSFTGISSRPWRFQT